MTKKKLIIATDCFLPRWDGIARFLLESIPALAKIWDITVIAPNFKGRDINFENVTVCRMPLSHITIGDYRVPKANVSKIEAIIQEADIVWNHTIGPIGKAAILASNKFNVPIVFQIHSIDYELIAKSLNMKAFMQDAVHALSKHHIIKYYKKCDLIITPSSNVEKMLEWNEVKVPSVRLDLGINLDKFKPPKDKDLAKQHIGIDPMVRVIGFCGRLAKEKNLETLFEAFKKIQGDYPEAVLLIVGAGLKNYEKTLERNPMILYVGEKDNVVPYLQAMDIFVLPSQIETTSLATLEAMACEVTPIATPVGYVKEYIKEKKNGLIFPIGNPTILSLKLKWLLREEYVCKKLGENARQTVKKLFDWERTEGEIINILKSIERKEEYTKPDLSDKDEEGDYVNIGVISDDT